MLKRILLALLLVVPMVANAKITSEGLLNTVCTNVVAVSVDPTSVNGDTRYINLVDNTSTGGVETGEDLYTVPVIMYASQLRVTSDDSLGSGSSDSHTYTLRDDATDASLTCTQATTETGCTDTSNISKLAAGSKLTVSQSTSGTTTTVSEALISFCLSP